MTIEAMAQHSTGQWFTGSDGHRWWFDSGSLALDFAYTGAMGDNPAWERLHGPADLTEWLTGRFERLAGEANERNLIEAGQLRAAIANLTMASVRGEGARGDDIDAINLFAATPDIPPSLSGGSLQAGGSRPRVTQALSTVARDAVALFGGQVAGRIRECSADDCGIVYFDTSRSANRRWCSMQRCGNRAKVRAHRARTASPAHDGAAE
ncbi:CGNR zinc finger domain-containing protein [Compostimonas suwonensis]|uniref:Putative RNA-binding Zn ribbon-like protein n=1 Tax=Compostimonas suwonensis TaxID=1048394 RepID=A0A2M9C579_9MICO|nr:CGNR zinc finger domain-containing protein [Compostimonas suwonensis]PJJ65684.1 putative RNA-binding Zn ribbon-like protein [Compostimonas suwonensis]